MIFVQICVGSSCYLKGSQEIVEMFQQAVEQYGLEDRVVLSGSFCMGKCNREGVSIQVDDEIHTGVTPGNFREFFQTNILDPLGGV